MDKKAAKVEYKLGRRPAGVFQIRDLASDKVFVGASKNLDAIFNRHRFQLEAGVHGNRELLAAWDRSGGSNFAFEILEELPPPRDANLDITADLEALELLWLEKLSPFGDAGFNDRPITREERLHRIAARSRGHAE
ncbi:MAG: hypothetical protein UZ17_ACD001001200 [Acidobacteria bacterium OLB17]|nr:MAG: hypothetical protein UZ17_ACD001001200 [Acidobacteria bacterium OLB17]MCZ2391856.1 GIY-YIG nuclease family protein [Acidobacteriota bacterium]